VCGLGGAFFLRDPRITERFASCAADALAHRGPDDYDRVDFGEGILVHRRLSILDPSPAGRQPFRSPDHDQWLVHNGEIYNYLELREQLRSLGHAFATDTDTEVMLAAYREWGPRAVERFNGIWAFALWDGTKRQLLLSRDRLGVKPMYFVETSEGICFASEIKALLDIAPTRDLNLGAVRDYGWHGLLDHSDATFYRSIQPLPPASLLVVGGRERRMERFWAIDALSTDADPRPAPEDPVRLQEFDEILTGAIRLQLRSDVPLGTCLSGGLDSSTIVAISSGLMRERVGEHEAPPRLAITAGFPGEADDESNAARGVADHAGIDHLVVVPRPGELLPMLQQLLREQDEPFISSSIFAQRAVMEGARAAGITVMLDGQGADELLGGYPQYLYPWLLGLARARPSAVPRALSDLRSRGVSLGLALRQAALSAFQMGASGIAPVGRAASPPAWMGPSLRAVPGLPLRDASDPLPEGTSLARHLRRAVLSTSLPALLRYEDRNSMRFAIEARVPFLDHRLVEAAMMLPDRLKIARAVTKIPLRRCGRGRLPESVRRDRRKIGFATPQAAWLSDARPAIREFLAESRGVSEGWFSRTELDRLVDGDIAADDGSALWRCLSLEMMLRK